MLLLISLLLEGLIYSVFWKQRKFLALVVIFVLFFSVLDTSFTSLTLSVTLISVALFRVINLMRIVKGRMHQQYLHKVALRTSALLAVIHVLSYMIFDFRLDTFGVDSAIALSSVQFIFAASITTFTSYNLLRTGFHKPSVNYTDKELPTVTLAIAARNETSDLTSCLESVVANNYPKLEILVLDDCSQDRTPEVIKSFAHDGVRFVKGEEPKDGWLAKNQAYQQLLESANGEFIIFCGVDVRLNSESISQIINHMLSRNKDMVSILPIRYGGSISTTVVQPLRYWWELALPRLLFNRPSVLSTCWGIKTKTLKDLGGFKGIAHSIVPEGVFARELIKSNKYSFLRSNENLEVRTTKNYFDQLELGLRMRYPQLRRRPENVFFLSIIEITMIVFPIITIISGLAQGFNVATYLAIYSLVLLMLTHSMIVASTNPSNTLWSLINFPICVIYELFINIYSMMKYEFLIVDWKGRNVCLPVMHTIPPTQFTDIVNGKS